LRQIGQLSFSLEGESKLFWLKFNVSATDDTVVVAVAATAALTWKA
jgi:hypothetical protein